ncbi:unnamed protein product [Taenia asiatica]|uniref:DUF3395 domain-containing protein n=1 Tax=Taenia asiatica TaxID=60517 RepID=A0A0R3VX73_TAEAS|nr:unnamed protein product [Taenia asiatica]
MWPYIDADWKNQLHTSESAFNADIVLVVYGTRGNSGPIIIRTSDCEKRLFRAGNIDEFKLSRKQIRSGESVRDSLPAEILSSDGLDPSAGLVLYRMKFYARVSLESIQQGHLGPKATLLGRYGDTGRRLIVLTTPFAKKLDDDLEVFECFLEAVYLGFLTHCRIGPISESRLGARFCVGIEVVDPMTSEIYRFPANVLIGSNKGRHMKEATLQREDASSVLFDGLNTIDDTDDNERRQLRMSVTQMVQQLTESVSENVKKYNFWRKFSTVCLLICANRLLILILLHGIDSQMTLHD